MTAPYKMVKLDLRKVQENVTDSDHTDAINPNYFKTAAV